jgi:hypothetical protein
MAKSGLSTDTWEHEARKRQQMLKEKRMPDSLPEASEAAMDDTHVFSPKDGLDRAEVMLGVYGTEEWILADLIRRRHLAGINTVQIDITWLVPSPFDLVSWVMENTNHSFTFISANRALIQCEHGLIKMTSGRGKMEVEHVGEPAWVKSWIEKIDAQFKRAENLIEWVYSAHGQSISVPLNYRPALRSAYPWIKGDLDDYIDNYLNSSSSVLILIGPPGLGKTTLIKNIIHRSGSDAKVAYDEKVMNDDGLFAGFIDDDSRFLIMEDADAFLQSRADGNTMMHKFLNVSDGLISAADKKLIFSTNLDKVGDIDAALMRPGRCFDVVQFRLLTVDEAQDVIDEAGAGSIPENKTLISLAEIFSQQPSDSFRRKKSIGFTS